MVRNDFTSNQDRFSEPNLLLSELKVLWEEKPLFPVKREVYFERHCNVQREERDIMKQKATDRAAVCDELYYTSQYKYLYF